MRNTSEWRQVFRAAGLPVNTVSQHQSDPLTLVVFLEPNIGWHNERSAVETLQGIDGVIAAQPSELTGTIITVWLR